MLIISKSFSLLISFLSACIQNPWALHKDVHAKMSKIQHIQTLKGNYKLKNNIKYNTIVIPSYHLFWNGYFSEGS